MAVRFSLRRGYRVELPGAPEQRIHTAPKVGSVALLGADVPGIRPKMLVAEGDLVTAGDILFTDRARPSIGFPAPLSGRVSSIALGAKRSLSAVVIETGPEPEDPEAGLAKGSTEEELRDTLLSRGMWPAFRTRPFNRLPPPDARPEAIFIRAIDTHPLSADPHVALEGRMDAFRAGARALTLLTSGPVYVCQGPGPDMANGIPGITQAVFEGPHPAGLSTTHVMMLRPGALEGPVWTIGFQDVAAIGELLETGIFPGQRVVALSGPRVGKPRLVRTPMGARLRDLVCDTVTPGPTAVRLLSGSVLSGHETIYLGRYNTQVTVLDALPPPHPRLLARLRQRFRANDAPLPIVPTEALENALPPGIPTVPLLRALSVGDTEAVRRLGAEALVEEDLELVSSVCTSHADYGALLRRVLDEMAEAG